MMREMRRKDRAISMEECEAILKSAEFGTLSTVDGEGMPHAVPMSYVWHGGVIYLHCAGMGLKADNMKGNPNICFSVVGFTKAVFRDGDYTSQFESVVIYAKAQEITGGDEHRNALYVLSEKYFPSHMDRFDSALALSPGTHVWKLVPVKITGKANKPEAGDING